jgi:DNA-binding CsgD family transcriptional regulator
MHVSVEYVQSALEAALWRMFEVVFRQKNCCLPRIGMAGNPYLDSLSLKMHSRVPFPVRTSFRSLRRILRRADDAGKPRIRLAIRNFSNARIAERTRSSRKNVQNYVSNIYQKLQVKDRFELIEFQRKSPLRNNNPQKTLFPLVSREFGCFFLFFYETRNLSVD